MRVVRVGEEHLADLLPLLEAYCDFYAVSPPREALEALVRALIADPAREGTQLIAYRDGGPAGFATLFWTWQTLSASRVGVMNDLFVAPEHRGSGAAEALMRACARECRRHGAAAMTWQTALDNDRAQRLYDRLGARRSRWLDYELPV